MPASTDYVVTKSPTIVASDATVAGLPWGSPANAKVADGGYADVLGGGVQTSVLSDAKNVASDGTRLWGGGIASDLPLLSGQNSQYYGEDGNAFAQLVNAGTEVSNYLIMHFGFSVPDDASITGLRLALKVIDWDSYLGRAISDYVVELTYDESGWGINKADNANWTTRGSWFWKSYGGSGDLWGLALTPWFVNTHLGAAYQVYTIADNGGVSAAVDTALMDVWYARSTQYLKATGFGFALPPDAVVTGIQADVKKIDMTSAGGALDRSVRLYKGGVLAGSDKASASAWPGSGTVVTYGGDGDLWGTTWTPADINSGGFGLGVAASAKTGGIQAGTPHYGIDSVPITVYYTQKSRIAHASNVM